MDIRLPLNSIYSIFDLAASLRLDNLFSFSPALRSAKSINYYYYYYFGRDSADTDAQNTIFIFDEETRIWILAENGIRIRMQSHGLCVVIFFGPSKQMHRPKTPQIILCKQLNTSHYLLQANECRLVLLPQSILMCGMYAPLPAEECLRSLKKHMSM